MFDRLELLIGKTSLEKLSKKHIVVLGLGGVGGYVVESLIRSGIENITIIDNDVIDISNLNRQIIATGDNIGKLKTDEFEKRILNINKNAKVKKISSFIDDSNISELFKDKIDYFIDACDTLKTKELVIKYCTSKGIKFITCLGTGKRLNPESVTICDLKRTSYDPIAKRLRKFIRDEGITDRVLCCYSKEIPVKTEGSVVASSVFVPSVAGISIASFVVRDIIGY